jgi:hypothetical protein
MQKFGINCQLWNKPFFIVTFNFSLVKAAMNTLLLCNWTKTVLMAWPWRNGVNKTSPFFYFSIAKGGTKTIAH